LTEGINKLKLGVTTELRDCEKEVELELRVSRFFIDTGVTKKNQKFSLGIFFSKLVDESMFLMQKIRVFF